MGGQKALGSGFGQQLRSHRLALGLTQEELAARSGMSVRAVADMERGRTTLPYRRSVALLADALGLSGEERVVFMRISREGLGGPEDRSVRPRLPSQARTLVVPRQLPAAVRHFAGRSAELAELTALLDHTGSGERSMVIAAIAGAAGVGKTALAVHWCHQTAHLFPDGQLYVNLRGFDPSGLPVVPAAALTAFLAALHVPPGQIPADPDSQVGLYRSLVAGRAVLVLLDNARDAEQVRPLLPGGPDCLAVVTSRSRLTGFVAAEGAHPLHLDVLTTSEAVDLMTGRLGSARTGAERDAAQAIARICGGLPLAVSIAAAQAASRTSVTLAALGRELRASQSLLDALSTGENATNLRAVFSWSYRMLSPRAARLFRLLGLHPGTDISAAAAGSLAGESASAAHRLLVELADAHLVNATELDRFSIHDLLKVYATDCAQEQETPVDRAEAIRRLLMWYLHSAARAAKTINPGRRHISLAAPEPDCEPAAFGGYDDALLWLETERANLVAAVACAGRYNIHEAAWKLPIALWDLFNLRGHRIEWTASLETGLASARQLNDLAAQGWLLNHLAIAYQQSGTTLKAIACMRDALAIRQAIEDRRGEASVLANLGRIYSEAGMLPESAECLNEALLAFQETGQRRERGICLSLLSVTYRRQGKLEDALISAQQAVDLVQQVGDQSEESGALTQLSLASLRLGRPKEAVAHAERAAAASRGCSDLLGQAEALSALGQARLAAGQYAKARQHLQDAQLIFNDIGDPRATETLGLLAELREGIHR